VPSGEPMPNNDRVNDWSASLYGEGEGIQLPAGSVQGDGRHGAAAPDPGAQATGYPGHHPRCRERSFTIRSERLAQRTQDSLL
jgi:hypothetical protein